MQIFEHECPELRGQPMERIRDHGANQEAAVCARGEVNQVDGESSLKVVAACLGNRDEEGRGSV